MTTTEKSPLVLPADWVPGPRQGRWTYDEYTALPDDGPRYEMVNGVLYMAPSPSWSHQGVVGELFAYLRTHVKLTDLGQVFMAPLDVELAPNTVVQPDVIVLLNASLAKLKEKHIIGPLILLLRSLHRVQVRMIGITSNLLTLVPLYRNIG
jgi:Uma2 family endonuclease